MPDCLHCGTPFTPTRDLTEFCCHGCEFVHQHILETGLETFYQLRGSAKLTPAKSTPFSTQDFDWLEARLAAAGAAPGSTLAADFSLHGISCIGCVWLVEKVFLREPGALSAHAHPVTGALHLEWRRGEANIPAFAEKLASFGYTLAPPNPREVSETGSLGARLGLCGAFMLNTMAFTLPSYLGMPPDFEFARLFHWICLVSATLSMLVGGGYFITRAWRSARAGQLHMDLPIALGLIAAYAGSLAGWLLDQPRLIYFDTVSTFVFLMLAGRYFQTATLEKNRYRMNRAKPVPETFATPDGGEPIPRSEIRSGVTYILRSGQSNPVTALLAEKPAEFSLEWINGESEPATFPAGRRVPAGAIHLGNAPVTLRAVESWEECLLARLLTSQRAAPRSPGLEKLLRIYLAAVLLAGFAAYLWLFPQHGHARAAQALISIFVISCPCAIGLALPLADELGNSAMERLGVFIRRPLLWTRLAAVRSVIFDKTGTLTLERPVLRNPEAIAALPPEARVALATLTAGSLHPVSRSLFEKLAAEPRSALPVTDVPGSGRWFNDGTATWSLGKPGWSPAPWSGLPAPSPVSTRDAELRRDGALLTSFSFEDSLRPDAIAAVAALRRRHLRTIILSGDSEEKVRATADALGIPQADARARLLPEEKQAIVREADRHDTLYLGDGANDSLALDSAWTSGTPVIDQSFLESKADFYFMGGTLRFLPLLLSFAKRRRVVVRAAFCFAVFYNITAIALCVAGHMNPLLAAVLMPASSLVCILIILFGLKTRR